MLLLPLLLPPLLSLLLLSPVAATAVSAVAAPSSCKLLMPCNKIVGVLQPAKIWHNYNLFLICCCCPCCCCCLCCCTNLACQLHVGAAREIALRCCCWFWCSFLALAWAPTQAQSVNLAAEWLATASCKCQLQVATVAVAVACAEVSESVLEKRRAMGMQTAEHTQAQPGGAHGGSGRARGGGATVVSFAAVSVCFLSCSSLRSLQRSAQWCKTMHA